MKTARRMCLGAVVVTVCAVAFLLGRKPAEMTEEALATKVKSPTLQAVPAVAQARPAALALAALPTNQTATVRGTKPFVLTCSVPIQKSLRLAAESLGARTVCSLSRNSLMVEADPATRARLVADGRFAAADEFLPSAKVDPDLMKQIADGAKSVEIVVVTLAAEDRLPMIERVKALGGEILTGCQNDGDNFRASLSAEQVAGLAVRGDVRWLEPFVRPHIANDLAVTATAMNVQTVWDVLPDGLNGNGQFVTTSDSGIDLGHPDLSDQVVGHKVVKGAHENDDNGHGTHTAGSIAGAGLMSLEREEGRILGSAWGAKLWAWFCGGEDGGILTPDTKEELFQPDQENAPAYIHSASWGAPQGGKYETECASTDLFVWKHPDFLPVYSAGNEGEDGETTIGSPAAAKNVLTVGATENVRTGTFGGHGPYPLIPSGDPTLTASYSSRGPCQDGRIKPDVAAPGSGVLSTRSHDVDYGYGIYEDHDGAYAEWYAFDCGTSMACPLAAGTVAVVRQWLTTSELGGFEDEEGTRPTAALMKAIVTGGARGAEVPDNDQGWGRVDVRETLFPTNRAVKLVDRIPFAENEEFAWVVETTNAAPLDVQLCWVDYPGSGAQEEAKLVNDLDLTVRPLDDLDGEILYGNGGESEDRLNNLESVRIASAAPQRYLVSVNCETILHDCTEGGAAALYIRGAFDPDMVSTNYGRVCIRETGKLFLSLDKALAAARDGETVEILEPVNLRATVAVTNVITIVATNDVAEASSVTPVGDARIELADGANVLFTNVVFNAGGRLTVNAQTGSVLRIAGCADLGEIRLATKENLRVAGYLTEPILVDAQFAKVNGEVFGSLESAEFGETANYLLNKYDEESGGEGVGTDVRWLLGASVPDAAAVARVEPIEEAYTNYRSLAVLLKYNRSGQVTVLKNTIFTNHLDGLVADMTIRGATDAIVVSPTDDAGFVVTNGGSLTFSNVTFSSRHGETAFVTVDGGEFTLEDGACLHRLDGVGPTTGAIEVDVGTMTMRPGSEIRDCANLSLVGGGGAIWLAGEGCTLNLEGGDITQCSAGTYGGAAYAVYGGAVVNLGGPLTVDGNISSGGSYDLVEDDLYFPKGTELTLTNNLTSGYVGLTYAYYDFPGDGKPFIGVAEGLRGEVSNQTLAYFVCELLDAEDGEAYEAAISEDGESLVWKAVPEGEARTEPDPDYDVARIVRGSETNYFYSIHGVRGAFKAAQDGDVIELLQSADFTSDIAVECAVTLRPVADGHKIFRAANCGFVVKAGGDLILDGVTVDGVNGKRGEDSSSTLFWVKGGSLTLTNGTVISAVSGNYNRAAGAVAVSDDGTFTMTEGTEIRNCINGYSNEQDSTAVGAALLVDKGTANLRGGTITGNRAYRAAGVFIGNEGVAYVRGDLFVKGNTKTSGDVDLSDFVVEEHGQLYLDGDLTGMATIGIEQGIPGSLLDTNVFGRVSEAALEACGGIFGATNYMTSAAKFFRDDNPLVVGRVVTNETEALLVWSTAIEGGVFVDKDGAAYGVVSAARIEWPSAVSDLVYDGNAKTGVVETVEGYWLEGNVATNAGTYKAMAYLEPGYLWADGSAMPKEIFWSIAKAVYDMTGITFEDATFTYDGQPKSIFISGDLPAGVMTNYYGNGRVEPGLWYEVRVKFTGDEVNYEKIMDMVAHITIEKGDDPDPTPQWEVATNHPTPIAFKSIDRVSDTEWVLVITDRVEFCNYRLIWTDDLAKGFTSTGDWEQAVGPAADPVWTTNVITTGGAWFWRAEGTEGTNMVPPQVEN